MQYRRDVDGLRAIAVLPVVVFHIAQSFLRGGYVGVDVFFVISGYLICGRIVRDFEKGRFSLLDFWARRFRRIAPAYAVMLTFVAGIVTLRYFPSELVEFGRALAASVLSVSNIYFWSTINYFNPAGELFPLLHGWSLSTEEQFYLLFPLLLLLTCRTPDRRRFSRIVLMSFAFSLALCAASPLFSTSFGFYSILTRAWEMLLGAILALGVVPKLQLRLHREIVASVGLLLLLGSMVLFSPFMAFPGYLALVPCLGAALLIHSGSEEDTLVARLLSLAPAVFVGRISYSLYLWHWPLLVLQKSDWIFVETNSKLVERSVVLALSFVFAVVSWRFVEKTTRTSSVPIARIVKAYGSLLGALLVFALFLTMTNGLPNLFSPQVQALAKYADYDFKSAMRVGTCLLSERMTLSQFDATACMPNDPAKPSFAVLGDSHAAALAGGLRDAYSDANILQITASGCFPFLAPQAAAPAASCEALMKYGLQDVPSRRALDGVWLFGRVGMGNVASNVENMIETAKALQGRGLNVVIIGPNPEFRVGLPRLLARAAIKGNHEYPQKFLTPEAALAEVQLKRAAELHGIPYVSIFEALCAGPCETEDAQGVPILFDADHFTREGAKLVAQRLRLKLRASK